MIQNWGDSLLSLHEQHLRLGLLNMPLDPAFVKATTDVKKLTSKPTDEERLQVGCPDLI